MSTAKAWRRVSPSGMASKHIAAALQREKNIKHWSREWKIDLIASSNPDWRDLYEDIVR
jgi:putative endonuclease